MSIKGMAAGLLVLTALAASGAGLALVLVETEEEVSIDEVPAAVRPTIEQYAAQGRITEIERETEDGKVVYEIELDVDGKEVEFQVSAAGDYLGQEDDDDADDD